MEQREFTCMVEFDRQFYPKDNKKIMDGDWGIVTARVYEIEVDGQMTDYHKLQRTSPKAKDYALHTDARFGTITMKGNMCEMHKDTRYKVTLKEVYDSKYERWSYDIKFIQERYSFDTEEKQRKFLLRILTERQVDNIFKEFENPMTVLDANDVEALTNVKGIGEKTAKDIIARYMATKDFGKAFVELAEYGLTSGMIYKLIDRYGSPDIVVSKVKDNPYILASEVDGIGFLKADAIALSVGYDANSPKRCSAFLQYFFSQMVQDGHSYVTGDHMMDAIYETLGYSFPSESISLALRWLADKNKLWFNEDRTVFALRKYYDIERMVAFHIVRLTNAENNFYFDNWEEKIAQVEQEQGWSFTDEQRVSIQSTLEHNIVITAGYGGCVDCDTEYFNGQEWKRIADYQDGEQVLQYNKDGSAELVTPSKYTKLPQDTLYHFQTKYGLDQCLSLGHRVVYQTSKGNLAIKPFEEIIRMHTNCKSGFTGKFYTTFDYSGQGIKMTADEIRLQIAVIADGHFNKETTNWCVMRLKKLRKCERIETLLNNANIDYEKQYEETTGFYIYKFYAPKREKEFLSYWYQCSKEQFAIVCDEVLHWDGSFTNGKERFSSSSSQTIDFIQFAFATIGKRSTIHIDNRVGQTITGYEEEGYAHKSIYYELNITNRNMVGMGGFHEGQTKTPITPYATKDGYQYCFTVPSTMLVLRRNGKIFITGNTGKTASVAGMLRVLEGYTFAQCALSGKASVNMMHVTGTDGYTIHRLLGYNPQTGWKHNEDNPLPYDIIILDEFSMVDAELFVRLLCAIRDGAKLIMLGDTGQLTNIGIGNVMFDLIDSQFVWSNQLTQIHRQAAKSAIITESIKLRNSQHIVNTGFEGRLVLGELQDLEILGYKEDENRGKGEDRKGVHYIMSEYMRIRPKVQNIMDIAVILPTNYRGTCTYRLNLLIQAKEINHKTGLNVRGIEIGGDHPYTLYIGDKVINTKNNYQSFYREYLGDDEFGLPIYNKVKREIYNGNMGIVTAIDHHNREIEVEFERIGKVTITSEDLANIQLGYAISVHKSQGATIPYVIVGLDYTHYKMLSRELVYTGITRAKTHCVLVAETRALRKATTTTNIISKQTFLPFFLDGSLPLL